MHDRLHGAPTTPPRPPTWPTLAPASGASDASRRTVRAGRSRAGLAADRQKAGGGQEVGQGENLKPGFFVPDGWIPRWRVCRNLSEPQMRPWRRHILVNRSECTGEREEERGDTRGAVNAPPHDAELLGLTSRGGVSGARTAVDASCDMARSSHAAPSPPHQRRTSTRR